MHNPHPSKIRLLLPLLTLVLVLSLDDSSATAQSKVSSTQILFLGIQNEHLQKDMAGVEKRATAFLAEAFTRSGRYTILELDAAKGRLKKKDITLADSQALKKNYPRLASVVTGSLTGDELATEITLKFVDVKTGEVMQTLKAANITTPHIEPIIRKLFLQLSGKTTGSASAGPQKPQKEIISLVAFENSSGDPGLNYLGPAIAESLITGLSDLKGCDIVERMQLDKILNELRLTSSWIFNPATTVETGRLLSPRYIIGGSFQKLGEYYRLNGRMIDVETGRTDRAESIIGKDIMDLPDKMAKIFVASIGKGKMWEKSASDKLTVEVKAVKEIPTSIYHVLPKIDGANIVEVALKNTSHDPLNVTVESEIQGYTQRAKEPVKMNPGEEKGLVLYPVFIPEKLNTLLTDRPATLLVTVKGPNGDSVYDKTIPVTLIARDIWIFTGHDFASNRIDMEGTIAAWVSPQSPAVAQILSAAVKVSPLQAFIGYQSGTVAGKDAPQKREEISRLQVKAIYDTLKQQGLKYVDQSIQYPDPEKNRQRVLHPQEAMKYQTANCIDGTVLFSSLLLRAGLNPIIILVPGHAYLGWETRARSSTYEVLETTRVGYDDFETAVQKGQEQNKKAFYHLNLEGLRFEKGLAIKGSATIINVRALKQHFGELPI